MRPMLDDLELPQVQEIVTYDYRTLAEHKPPGMQGSFLQDMGRGLTHVTVWGVAADDDVTEFVAALDARFRAAKPVPFTADIVADARLEQVVIEDVQWQELAGKSQRLAYALVLREHREPPAPTEQAPADVSQSVDAAASLAAAAQLDDLLAGLDIGGAFATGLERFVEPLGAFLQRLQQFNQG